MRSLIAEDDATSIFFMKKILGKYGECESATDGIAALDAFVKAMKEKNMYDLICLDVMMPKMDGLTTLKIIRGIEAQAGILKHNRVKIIIMTALSDTETIVSTYDTCCDAFVCKPVEIGEFVQTLQQLGLVEHGIK